MAKTWFFIETYKRIIASCNQSSRESLLLSATSGKGMKTNSKNSFMFWRNWGHRLLSRLLGVFLETLKSSLLRLHSCTLFQCGPPSTFTKAMFSQSTPERRVCPGHFTMSLRKKWLAEMAAFQLRSDEQKLFLLSISKLCGYWKAAFVQESSTPKKMHSLKDVKCQL